MKKKSISLTIEKNVFGYSDLFQNNSKYTQAINPAFNPGALKRVKLKQTNVLRQYQVVKPLHYLVDGNKKTLSEGDLITFNEVRKHRQQIQ